MYTLLPVLPDNYILNCTPARLTQSKQTEQKLTDITFVAISYISNKLICDCICYAFTCLYSCIAKILIHAAWTCNIKLTHGQKLQHNTQQMDPRLFIYLLKTSCSAAEPTPDTSKKQRSMQPTNAHWPKWHQRDDSTQLSFSDTAVPLCTASDLASKTASASDCTRGRTRTDTASESYHTKRRRDTLPVPTRNVGSLNSIRTKQPRRCLKIHPPDSMLLVWLCKNSLIAKSK